MARPVAIVIDSTSSIPAEFLDTLPITVAPAMLQWGGVTYRDYIDISPVEFYIRLRTDPEQPTTSQVTPAVLGQAFDQLLGEGYAVLAILLSSRLSGTYNSGLIAKDERPDQPIVILDSLSSGMGLGWAGITAARAAQAGLDLAGCQAVAEKAFQNIGVVGTVKSLKYLHRAGRIGGASRFLGSALQLKPVLEVADGIIEGVDRVRTRSKAIARMLDLLEERIAGREPVRLGVMHANDLEVAEKLVDMVQERFSPLETVVSDFSPILGANFGEGTVGVCYIAGME